MTGTSAQSGILETLWKGVNNAKVEPRVIPVHAAPVVEGGSPVAEQLQSLLMR